VDRPRRLLLLGGALCGYLAAIVGAHLLVSLRSAGVDPAVVAASSGMWAFGDFVAEVLVAGLLSVAPTWVLVRALRDVEWLWRSASRAGLAWSVIAPAAAAVWIAGSCSQAPAGTPSFSLAGVLALHRLIASPPSVLALAVAWFGCVPGPARRRLGSATLLEGAGLVAAAAWFAVQLIRARW
jgi:hypothetical protein